MVIEDLLVFSLFSLNLVFVVMNMNTARHHRKTEKYMDQYFKNMDKMYQKLILGGPYENSNRSRR